HQAGARRRRKRLRHEIRRGRGVGQGGRQGPRRRPVRFVVGACCAWRRVERRLKDIETFRPTRSTTQTTREAVMIEVEKETRRSKTTRDQTAMSRRNILLAGTAMAAASAVGSGAVISTAQAQQNQAAPSGRRPNILVIFGDDIGYWNVSTYNNGLMGWTPNIDRIGKEGIIFTDHYGQPSCTAGRAAFLMGQLPVRTGMTTVGIPGSTRGIQKGDPTLAELLKPLGYATAQFGKNHLGDRNEFLPTMHGFDYWFGNLYHLNAEEEPEELDYPGQKRPEYRQKF